MLLVSHLCQHLSSVNIQALTKQQHVLRIVWHHLLAPVSYQLSILVSKIGIASCYHHALHRLSQNLISLYHNMMAHHLTDKQHYFRVSYWNILQRPFTKTAIRFFTFGSSVSRSFSCSFQLFLLSKMVEIRCKTARLHMFVAI